MEIVDKKTWIEERTDNPNRLGLAVWEEEYKDKVFGCLGITGSQGYPQKLREMIEECINKYGLSCDLDDEKQRALMASIFIDTSSISETLKDPGFQKVLDFIAQKSNAKLSYVNTEADNCNKSLKQTIEKCSNYPTQSASEKSVQTADLDENKKEEIGNSVKANRNRKGNLNKIFSIFGAALIALSGYVEKEDHTPVELGAKNAQTTKYTLKVGTLGMDMVRLDVDKEKDTWSLRLPLSETLKEVNNCVGINRVKKEINFDEWKKNPIESALTLGEMENTEPTTPASDALTAETINGLIDLKKMR